jgi:ribonuclease T2
MWIRRWLLILLVGGLASVTADAEVLLEGYFIARKVCPVFQSIKHETNPGNAQTKIARAYDLHSKNAEVASHYLVEFPGVQPSRRWVAVSCGQHVVLAGKPGPGEGGGKSFVLAVSWQPGFCETKPEKPECASMTSDRFDATHFSLHGLWPQPRSNVYCNVEPAQIALDKDRRWNELDPLELTPETRASLDVVMPGTMSGLHRHEWVKHGSCYGDGAPEEYFRDSLGLIDALNASGVQDLFETNIGQNIATAAISAAFSAGFGLEAGERVKFMCNRDQARTLITEMQLQLRGTISENPDLGELLSAGSRVGRGCSMGVIDPAGFQ